MTARDFFTRVFKIEEVRVSTDNHKFLGPRELRQRLRKNPVDRKQKKKVQYEGVDPSEW